MRWPVLAGGLALAVAGAVLAFALQPDRPADWSALGLILLIAGLATLLGWGAVQLSPVARPRAEQRSQVAGNEPAEGSAPRPPPPGDRGLSGLLAVVSGIVAVVILGVVTLALLRAGADNNATVAIATSAFGVISAVVGAYLGVKIGAEQGQAATATAGAQTQEVAKAAREATAQAKAATEAVGAQTERVAEVAREATAQARAATEAAGAQTEKAAEVAREARAATEAAHEAIVQSKGEGG